MKSIAVVSLVNEYARREHIDHLFHEHHLDFSYFDAINKQQVADTLEKYNLTVNTDKLSAGEIGCILSHYSLWQQMVEYNLRYLIVFEDDIYLAKGAKNLLNNLSWLPDDFDLIKLETMYEEVMLKKVIKLNPPYHLLHMKSRHLGTAGYIISQQTAKKIMNNINVLGIQVPVDHMIFEELINEENSKVYQISPAICIQDLVLNKKSSKFKSGIEEERKILRPEAKTKKPKESYSKSQKLNREAKRIYLQIYNFLNPKEYKKIKVDYDI